MNTKVITSTLQQLLPDWPQGVIPALIEFLPEKLLKEVLFSDYPEDILKGQGCTKDCWYVTISGCKAYNEIKEFSTLANTHVPGSCRVLRYRPLGYTWHYVRMDYMEFSEIIRSTALANKYSIKEIEYVIEDMEAMERLWPIYFSDRFWRGTEQFENALWVEYYSHGDPFKDK